MKQFFTLLLAAVVGSVSAQYLPLKDFNDASVTSGGWSTYMSVGTHDWVPGSFGGSDWAECSGWNGAGNDDAEAWLLSPIFSLAAATAPELTFETVAGPGAVDVALEVYVSTNFAGGDPNAGGVVWTQLSPTLDAGSWGAFTPSGGVDLSTYVGQTTVSIGFKYQSTAVPDAGDKWEVDNIMVDEPTVIPFVSIYDIQYTTANPADSPELGNVVRTSGTVVHQSDSARGYFIANGPGAWQGMFIYDPVNTPSVGDSVTVEGEIDEYWDYTEMINVASMVVETSGNTPATATVLSTLAANDEMYESVLVKVENAECITSTDANGEWTVNDGSGVVMVDDWVTGRGSLQYQSTVGKYYHVTGFINWSFSNFKIEPRDFNDIQEFVGIGENGNAPAMGTFPNPMDNVLNIDLTAWNSTAQITVRVLDITGAIVLEQAVNAGNVQVNVESIAKGIYQLQVSQGATTATTQVVKL